MFTFSHFISLFFPLFDLVLLDEPTETNTQTNSHTYLMLPPLEMQKEFHPETIRSSVYMVVILSNGLAKVYTTPFQCD